VNAENTRQQPLRELDSMQQPGGGAGRGSAATLNGVNSTIDLPWPVPDRRARYFAGEFADMHSIVKPLQVPDHIPANTARAFITARELIRFSFYHYEFAAVAVSTAIIAIEAALRER
jgi:hypothetical protein